jgi:uncharacterized membrane protein
MVSSTLAVAAVVAVITAIAFWLDRHVPFFSKIGASLLVILLGAVLSNLGVIAPRSPVYDAISGPVTSLAIVWLLLAVHIGDLRHAGPRMLGAFALATVATLIGAAIGWYMFGHAFGDETWRLAGAFVGTYTGGSLNFVAVGRALKLPQTLFAGATAADNLTTGIWMGACLLLPVWLRRLYPTPIPGEPDGAPASAIAPDGGAAATPHTSSAVELVHPFFSPAPVSVLSVAALLAIGLTLLQAARGLAHVVPAIPDVLWLTTLALVVGHLPWFARMDGAMQLGNVALHLFFAVIGIYSRVADILAVGVAVFFFTSVIVGVHGLIVFVVGRFFRLDVGTLAVASQAAIGGPTSALAVAVSREWPALILPGVLVGLLGYAVGNYLGFGAAYLLR